MLLTIYGPDTFRSQQKLNELKDQFIKKVDKSAYNIITVDAKENDLQKIKSEMLSSGFLTQKKMVIIKNTFQQNQEFQKKLCELIKKNKEQDNAIIFYEETDISTTKNELAKYLLKQKFVYPYKLLEINDLEKWTDREIKLRGGKIEKNALSLLIETVGSDTWQLNSEIDKLIGYREGKIITVQDIESLVKGKIDENIFKLTDAIGGKNKKQAIILFNNLLKGSFEPTRIFSMVARQFKIIMEIKDLEQKGARDYRDIAKKINEHPFAVQKALAQSRAFTSEELKKTYNQLLEIDGKVKTSQADLETLINLFMCKI